MTAHTTDEDCTVGEDGCRGCTDASHASLKLDMRRFMQEMTPAGVQVDENGKPALQLFECRRCHTTLSLPLPACWEPRS